MLMSDLMKIIWADKRQSYEKIYYYAMSLSDDELFQKVRNEKMTFYSYPSVNMNLISCSVCTYRLENNFSGCSMCDYEIDDLKHPAYMAALKSKNSSLYAKAILQNFLNVRGKNSSPNIYEFISSYDVFRDEEFSDEVFYELFVANNLFSKRPFCYKVEARASSITRGKLNQIRNYLPKGHRLIIEFGVEIGNEWIRNHWLNKEVNNTQIKSAIELIHESGYKASADILLGIPGFTEMQSRKSFIETVLWLDEFNVDQYIVLPLNRKINTLQGIIHKYLRDNPSLKNIGLAQGEHTGIPWLNTIILAIDEILDICPSLVKKLNLGQVISYQNSVNNMTAYNLNDCHCNKKLTEALLSYQNKRDKNLIKEAADYCRTNYHDCSDSYDKLICLQGNQGIPTTTKLIINELTPFIWGDDFESKNRQFKEEIDEFKELTFQ